MQKRETERQALMRTRSYTHHREKLAAEEAMKLKPSTSESHNILTRSCAKVLQAHPGEVAMGVSRKEYLRHASPAFWVTRRPQYAYSTPMYLYIAVLSFPVTVTGPYTGALTDVARPTSVGGLVWRKGAPTSLARRSRRPDGAEDPAGHGTHSNG